MEDVGGQADGGCGIALDRFGEHLAGRDFGKLADNLVAQMVVGEDPKAFGRNDGRETFDGGLDQRALPDDVEDLFGGTLAAARPEARAAAAGEDQSGRSVIKS